MTVVYIGIKMEKKGHSTWGEIYQKRLKLTLGLNLKDDVLARWIRKREKMQTRQAYLHSST